MIQFKCNQQVWDRTISNKPGRVVTLGEIEEQYPLGVQFEDRKFFYTLDGRKEIDHKIALLKPFYYELVELETLPEVGTVVYAWDYRDEEDESLDPEVTVGFFVRKSKNGYEISKFFKEGHISTYDKISTERPNWI